MSRLFERMMTPCVMLSKVSAPDGEGGVTSTWVDGKAFRAAVIKDTDIAAKIAEQSTHTEAYTITSARKLAFHDVFRRVSDGRVFRVVSDGADSAPPTEAGFAFYQAKAEGWAES